MGLGCLLQQHNFGKDPDNMHVNAYHTDCLHPLKQEGVPHTQRSLDRKSRRKGSEQPWRGEELDKHTVCAEVPAQEARGAVTVATALVATVLVATVLMPRCCGRFLFVWTYSASVASSRSGWRKSRARRGAQATRLQQEA